MCLDLPLVRFFLCQWNGYVTLRVYLENRISLPRERERRAFLLVYIWGSLRVCLYLARNHHAEIAELALKPHALLKSRDTESTLLTQLSGAGTYKDSLETSSQCHLALCSLRYVSQHISSWLRIFLLCCIDIPRETVPELKLTRACLLGKAISIRQGHLN